MSLPLDIPNPYIQALVIGVLYGMVFCTSACLPYVASYVAGIGANFRKGVIATLTYNMGRVTAYSLIGGLIGLLGGVFRFVVSEPLISTFQNYSSFGFGVVTAIICAEILLRSKSSHHECFTKGNKTLDLTRTKKSFDVRAFSLGFSRGLVICPPLVLLLLYSIPFASPSGSFVVAVFFGLGTTLSPMLLLGGVTGWLLNKAPSFRKWISVIGGIALIVLGAATLVNTILFLNI